MALSVRVGRAHVTVDGVYRPSSMKKVGKQIEAQLSAIAARNRSFYQSLGTDMVTAWRAALGAMVTSAPLIGSLVSGLTGGVTMLAGALWSTLTAASAALPVLTSIGIAAGTAKIAFTGFGSAVSAADPESLTAALAKLSPEAGASAIAVRSLRDEVTNLRLVVQENFFAGLSDDIEKLATTLMPVATAGFGQMATVLNGLAQSMLDYVNSSAGLSVINDVFKNSASVVGALSGAVVPFLDGFLRLVNALSPAAERLAGRITDIALRFQGWTQAEGFATRIDEGMQKAEKTAGLLFDVLGNLGSIIGNIFDAANPSTNTFLEILGRVTGRFKEFTESVGGQQAIAKWAEESVTVLSQFGETIRAVFEVLQDLSDPRVITSFLTTVEEAFTLLGNLPLEEAVTAFADLAEALQPISGPMLAIIVAGVSLQMMFGSLLGQMAGAFSVFTTLRKGLDKVKTGFAGLGGAGKHASSVGKLSAAMGKLGGILAKGLKFAGLLGLGVTIVSVIAKSENLQNKLKAVWDSVKGVFESLGGAFSGVSSAAGPLLSALDPVFNIFEKIVGMGIGLVLDTIKFAFDSLGKAIEGAGTFISGFLKVLTGIFTLDFGMILEGLKTAISGIPALLQGLFGLFITFFAPAKLLSIGAKFFGGLTSGIRSALPGIPQAISGFFTGTVFPFFATLGARFLSTGTSLIRGLGSGISAGFNAIKTFFTQFIDDALVTLQGGFAFIRGIADAAMNGLSLMFSTAWNAIKTVFSTVWNAIAAAFKYVIDQILPGAQLFWAGLKDLFGAGVAFIKNIWDAAWMSIRLVVDTVMSTIRGVITKIMGSIKNTFSTVWNSIKATVSNVVNSIRNAISTAMNTVRDIVSTVMNTVRNTFSTAWNTIKTTVSNVVNTIRTTISDRLNAIKTNISSAMDTAKNTFSRAWNAIKTTVSDAISNVVGKVREIPGKITSALGDLGSLLRGAGRDVIQGLINGITSKLGDVGSAMSGIASKIRSYLPFSPVKEGPLRKWNNGAPGKTLIGMLNKGMSQAMPSIDRTMTDLTKRIDDSQRDAERSAGRLASTLAGSTTSSLSLPSLTGSPSRAGTSSVTSPGSTSGASGPGETNVYVTIDPKDLDGLRTVQDFLDMLNVRTAMVRGV